MKRLLLIAFCPLLAIPCLGQMQQAWVKRYSLTSSAVNQATAMALSPEGNIIVAGSSASTNGDLDYVVIKYTPNGQQLWLTRYDSPTNGADSLRSMAVDTNGSVLLTGTTKMVKLDGNGNVLWTAPYGGRSLTMDVSNVWVTGFSEVDFATAKLNGLNGSNIWTRTHDCIGRDDKSYAITVDNLGNVYVGGSETWDYFTNSSTTFIRARMALIKYDSSGNAVWTNNSGPTGEMGVTVNKIVSDDQGNIYILGNSGIANSYQATKCDPNGSTVWTKYLGGGYLDQGVNMVKDANVNLYLTGRAVSVGTSDYKYKTVKLNSDGQSLWASTYHGSVVGNNIGIGLALDASGNVYVTGYSPGIGTGNDFATLKYDSNGNQLWVQRYNGAADGDDFGGGIVVDGQTNIYVTGYSATTNGGTEFVTIKYQELQTIQKKVMATSNYNFLAVPAKATACRPPPTSSSGMNWVRSRPTATASFSFWTPTPRSSDTASTAGIRREFSAAKIRLFFHLQTAMLSA